MGLVYPDNITFQCPGQDFISMLSGVKTIDGESYD